MGTHDAIEFAGLAGELLLTNGAETSRIEDTVRRICDKSGLEEAEVIVFPTGIIINGKFQGNRLTKVKRIKNRFINLTAITIVNDTSRKYAAGTISLKEGVMILERTRLSELTTYKRSWRILAGASASGTATILFGGSIHDFFSAVISTIIVRLISGARIFDNTYVIQNYLAGFFAGSTASIFVSNGFGQHVDKIIIGALIPLFPGVALTNAIRDFISGDLLSGIMRLVEAFLIAVALAGGVGLALSLGKIF